MNDPLHLSDYKSGIYEPQYGYRSFLPTSIYRQWRFDTPELITLLSDADRKLGELNAFSQLVPDVDFFIKMHITKEATTSSRIEGTQTNIEEALIKVEDVDPERRDDWEEVQNYIQAISFSMDELQRLPISTRLIRATHRILLQGVRGQHKQPGEYRNSQNWIGATLKDATFVPPHHTHLNMLMSDLEQFLNDPSVEVPHLIKIGIIHYQFETIHPFLDGNGRLGRLLITLYLVSNGLLVKPALYLSNFFEQNRLHYYDNLHRVRTHSELGQWLKFFLAGVIQTAESSIDTFKQIIALRQRLESGPLLQLGKRAENAFRLMRCLYQQPVVTARYIEQMLEVDISTATRLLNDFVRLGILHEVTGFKRNRLFYFQEYLNLFHR